MLSLGVDAAGVEREDAAPAATMRRLQSLRATVAARRERYAWDGADPLVGREREVGVPGEGPFRSDPEAQRAAAADAVRRPAGTADVHQTGDAARHDRCCVDTDRAAEVAHCGTDVFGEIRGIAPAPRRSEGDRR